MLIEEVPDLDTMLLYIRGGSIFSRKDIARRSSLAMKYDPMTIVVALDKNGQASGSLYVDDGESYDYAEKEAFARIQFEANIESATNTLNLKFEVTGMTSLLSKDLLQANRLVLMQSSGHCELSLDLYLGTSGKHQFQL